MKAKVRRWLSERLSEMSAKIEDWSWRVRPADVEAENEVERSIQRKLDTLVDWSVLPKNYMKVDTTARFLLPQQVEGHPPGVDGAPV